MKRFTFLAIALGGLLLLVSAETAQAQYQYGRGWGGYSSYRSGGYYAPGYQNYGWPSSNYGWNGPYNRWSYSTPYSYGGYPTYYTTPGYTYRSAPSYGRTYYSGPTSYSGPTYYGTTSTAVAPTSGSYQSFYSGPMNTGVAADRARLHVVLPTSDAQLWVENEATQQQGIERRFDSPPVQPGKEYVYTVRARWTQNGREVTATKEVTVRPGQETTVSFGGSDVEQNP